MVVDMSNPSIWEAEASGWDLWVRGQPGLHRETLSQNTHTHTHCELGLVEPIISAAVSSLTPELQYNSETVSQHRKQKCLHTLWNVKQALK